MNRNLIARYEAGELTAGHLFMQLVHQVDPAAPDLALGQIPDHLSDGFRAFIDAYRPDRMVTNYGILPAIDRVMAAKDWAARSGRLATTDRAS